MINNSNIFGSSYAFADSCLFGEKCYEDVKYYVFGSKHLVDSLKYTDKVCYKPVNMKPSESLIRHIIGGDGLVTYNVSKGLESIGELYNEHNDDLFIIELNPLMIPCERVEFTPKELKEFKDTLDKEFEEFRKSSKGVPSFDDWLGYSRDVLGYGERFYYKSREFDETSLKIGFLPNLRRDMIKNIYCYSDFEK